MPSTDWNSEIQVSHKEPRDTGALVHLLHHRATRTCPAQGHPRQSVYVLLNMYHSFHSLPKFKEKFLDYHTQNNLYHHYFSPYLHYFSSEP